MGVARCCREGECDVFAATYLYNKDVLVSRPIVAVTMFDKVARIFVMVWFVVCGTACLCHKWILADLLEVSDAWQISTR